MSRVYLFLLSIFYETHVGKLRSIRNLVHFYFYEMRAVRGPSWNATIWSICSNIYNMEMRRANIAFYMKRARLRWIVAMWENLNINITQQQTRSHIAEHIHNHKPNRQEWNECLSSAIYWEIKVLLSRKGSSLLVFRSAYIHLYAALPQVVDGRLFQFQRNMKHICWYWWLCESPSAREDEQRSKKWKCNLAHQESINITQSCIVSE